jgi:hypothetical protein
MAARRFAQSSSVFTGAAAPSPPVNSITRSRASCPSAGAALAHKPAAIPRHIQRSKADGKIKRIDAFSPKLGKLRDSNRISDGVQQRQHLQAVYTAQVTDRTAFPMPSVPPEPYWLRVIG